eukprot:sb/3463950/
MPVAMLLKLILTVCCFFAHASAGNILVAAVLTGSHLSAPYDVAVELANAGHNITFMCMVKGGKASSTHPNITWVEPEVGREMGSFRSTCMEDLISRHSSKMIQMTQSCIDVWGSVWENANAVVSSAQFLEIASKSDLLVSEMPEPTGISALGAKLNIPVVKFLTEALTNPGLAQNNLPRLLTTQPGPLFMENFHRAPTFLERLNSFYILFRHHMPYITMFKSHQQLMENKFGASSDGAVKLILGNDQNAMSFPSLRAPNELQIGAINLLDSSPPALSPELAEFVEPGVILLSFGSYVRTDGHWPWFQELITILENLDMRVVIKTNDDSNLPNNFLPMSWIPQRSLLASGKVRLFISHCGNNGRLETIFYAVPVLCIPLFADQDFNAELIKFRGFGEKIWKENIDVEAAGKLQQMLGDLSSYQERMKRAVRRVKESFVRERLVSLIGELVERGELDDMVNKVALDQGTIQMYNIDVMATILVTMVTVVMVLIVTIYKCVSVVCCRAKEKCE